MSLVSWITLLVLLSASFDRSLAQQLTPDAFLTREQWEAKLGQQRQSIQQRQNALRKRASLNATFTELQTAKAISDPSVTSGNLMMARRGLFAFRGKPDIFVRPATR